MLDTWFFLSKISARLPASSAKKVTLLCSFSFLWNSPSLRSLIFQFGWLPRFFKPIWVFGKIETFKVAVTYMRYFARSKLEDFSSQENIWLDVTGSPHFRIKVTLLHGCFSRFLNCKDGTKSRKGSHIVYQQGTSRKKRFWKKDFIFFIWSTKRTKRSYYIYRLKY